MVTKRGVKARVVSVAATDGPVELHPRPLTKPKRALPTERIAFGRQIDLLRAWGAASGVSGKPVSLAEVAKVAGMATQTVTLANAFFIEAGFLIRADSGSLAPATAVRDLVQAHQWTPETFTTKLAPALRAHWAFQTLEPRLRFQRMSARDAITLLAETIGASTKYRPQLELVIEFLKSAGLIVADGDHLILGVAGTSAASTTPAEAESDAAALKDALRPVTSGRGRSVDSTFTQQPEGLVQFAVSVRVDMAELSTWSPDRIGAFFGGIAQVLAAKGNLEAGAGQDGAS